MFGGVCNWNLRSRVHCWHGCAEGAPKLPPGLHFGTPEITASAREPLAGKGGALEPPSDCFTVLQYRTNLCSLTLSIRSSSVRHYAMLLPLKYSSVMLSCTLLQTVCKPVMDRELSPPQQNSSPCSLVSKAFCAWCCHLHSGLD